MEKEDVDKSRGTTPLDMPGWVREDKEIDEWLNQGYEDSRFKSSAQIPRLGKPMIFGTAGEDPGLEQYKALWEDSDKPFNYKVIGGYDPYKENGSGSVAFFKNDIKEGEVHDMIQNQGIPLSDVLTRVYPLETPGTGKQIVFGTVDHPRRKKRKK